MDSETISAYGTAAAAVATSIVAWLTHKALRHGQKQQAEATKHFTDTQEIAERHHQDSFRPVVVLTPSNPMDTLIRNNLVSSDPNAEKIKLECAARNIGCGAALNIMLSVRSEGRTGFGASRALSPMSAGDTLKNRNGHILIDVQLNDQFNTQDLINLTHGHWVVAIEYEDIFGNHFHTLHHKNPALLWAIVGRDKAPDTTPVALDAASNLTWRP